MSYIYLIAVIFLAVLFFGVFSRKILFRRIFAVILFLVITIGATFFFEAGVRIVLEDAHQAGELSSGFVLGVRRLSGWFIWGRIIVAISALGLLVMIFRSPRD